jgi:hypothetical protein
MNGLTVSYQQAQDGLRDIAQRRRAARHELEAAHQAYADGEAAYRRARAAAYATVEGPNASARDAIVDAQTSGERHARDIAKGRIDVARAALDEIDGERSSLHRLLEWSMRIDPNALMGGEDQRSAA